MGGWQGVSPEGWLALNRAEPEGEAVVGGAGGTFGAFSWQLGQADAPDPLLVTSAPRKVQACLCASLDHCLGTAGTAGQ